MPIKFTHTAEILLCPETEHFSSVQVDVGDVLDRQNPFTYRMGGKPGLGVWSEPLGLTPRAGGITVAVRMAGRRRRERQSLPTSVGKDYQTPEFQSLPQSREGSGWGRRSGADGGKARGIKRREADIGVTRQQSRLWSPRCRERTKACCTCENTIFLACIWKEEQQIIVRRTVRAGRGGEASSFAAMSEKGWM